jgi:hypothetical protein
MVAIAVDISGMIAVFAGNELKLYNRLFYESVTRGDLESTSLVSQ